jgi:hypothetical protein
VDFVWLVVPAAVGVFVLRAVLIARKLRLAGRNLTMADARALREARRALQNHRGHLERAVAAPKAHLAAAKRLSRLPARTPATGVDAMVEDFLPERRL